MNLGKALVILGFLAWLSGCQAPMGISGDSSQPLTISILFQGSTLAGGANAHGLSGTRLLIPTVGTLTITLTPVGSGSIHSKTVNLDGTQNLVNVSLPTIPYGNYNVSAKVANASSQVLFSGSTSLSLNAATDSLSLNLVPVNGTSSSQQALAVGTTAATTSLAALSFQTWSTSSLPAKYTLYLAAPTGMSLYVQDAGGATLTGVNQGAAPNLVQTYTGNSSGFVTLYNSTASAQTYSLSLVDLDTGLKLYLPFNGNTQDSISGVSGTNNSSGFVSDRNGNPNSAISFLGSGTTNVVYSGAFASQSTVSISCWVTKNTTVSGTFFQSLNSSIVLNENIGPPFLIGAIIANSITPSSTHSTSLTPNSNTWHLVVVTYDRNSFIVYLDGTPSSPGTYADSGWLFQGPITIGQGSADYWTGSIDDFRVYNRVLNLSEVITLNNLKN